MGNKGLTNKLLIFLTMIVISGCAKGQSLITIPKCIIFPASNSVQFWYNTILMKHITTLFILFASLNVYSQKFIITEDVIMNHDTLKYNTAKYIISRSPNITTLELTPKDCFIDNMPTYNPKFIQESQIEKLQSEVDELKSQVKELSILLKELLESKK